MAKKTYLVDICGQYATITQWAEQNGLRWDDFPVQAKTEDGEDIIVDMYGEEDGIVFSLLDPFLSDVSLFNNSVFVVGVYTQPSV